MSFALSLSLSFAQAAPESVSNSPPLEKVSATQAINAIASESTPLEPMESPVNEPFQLAAEQHKWARLQPGAWREIQTVTETFDESGQVVSRNVTTQKEVLQTVAEGKYVLLVQATVDLGGKRIVGEEKSIALRLETDGAGLITDSRRLKDQTLQLVMRDVECQVFELHYQDNTRKLTDRVLYDPLQFPFILRRETTNDNDPADGSNKGSGEGSAKTLQLIEVVAQAVPYRLGDQLLNCSCLRTTRHRAKGETLRLAFSNINVPGWEVVVWSTDFDIEGRRDRWSVTTLLGFGETSPDIVDNTSSK